MPKRGGGLNGRSSLYQNDYDDRRKDRNTRRVSFKPSVLQPHGRYGGRSDDRTTEMGIRMRLEEDEDMGFLKDERQMTRRKGSPIPRGKFGNSRKLIESTFGWYQITVNNGQRYPKDEVLRAILNALSPAIFIPHYWRVEKHGVIFFVDDYKLAEEFQKIERSVQMKDGQRLFIRCRGGCPVVSIDEEFKDKMKNVMSRRYNAINRALDLSNFHKDEEFKFVFCGLFRIPVMAVALEIIEKHIPDIVAINLNNNNLTNVETFRNLHNRLPQLRILYLGDNKITSLANLLVLRHVPLTEIMLKGNPLRSRYKDQDHYVSEVLRKFPKLAILDGEPIETGKKSSDNKVQLPPSHKFYATDVKALDIARQFLEAYFPIFDSNDRQPLLDAYHDQAMMSISVPPASQAGRLYSFWKYNRNFRRINAHENSVKIRLLKTGKLAIVSTLAEWPRTQHDISSFTIDLTLSTPQVICFTVSGLFKEIGEKHESNDNTNLIRHFQRMYMVVPNNNGFCIRNEMILITNAEPSQVSSFMKNGTGLTINLDLHAATSISNLTSSLEQMATTSSTIASAPMNVAAPISAPVSAPIAANVLTEDMKFSLLKSIADLTGMNLDWSKKCLEENNWDYNASLCVFNRLNGSNQIPADAFVKH